MKFKPIERKDLLTYLLNEESCFSVFPEDGEEVNNKFIANNALEFRYVPTRTPILATKRNDDEEMQAWCCNSNLSHRRLFESLWFIEDK